MSATAAEAAPLLRNPLAGDRVEHPPAFRRRRFLNWFPLGVAYAMLYMGRYNLTVAQGALGALMPKESFGDIFGVGAVVYGCAFALNGPLTDRMGGRRAMLLALAGAFAANLGMGLYVHRAIHSGSADIDSVKRALTALYGVNMYFQSFGAVSIIKVNSSWFHIRERGGFGGIFGTMIASGYVFALDVNQRILDSITDPSLFRGLPSWLVPPHLREFGEFASATLAPGWIVFLVPAGALFATFVFEALFLKNHPSDTGHADIETGDASSHDEGHVSLLSLLRRIFTNRVIMTVAVIEFCTGACRDGISQWFRIYAVEQTKLLGAASPAASGFHFAVDHLGALTFFAGVLGGNIAGWVSDKVFHSRRGPVAFLLYALYAACLVGVLALLQVGWAMCGLATVMLLCVIGTHGLLSGTASMDFGGKKGAATATGVIDGFVYLGSALQAFALGHIIHERGWSSWPLFLVPFAAVGGVLLLTIWRAMPARRRVGGH